MNKEAMRNYLLGIEQDLTERLNSLWDTLPQAEQAKELPNDAWERLNKLQEELSEFVPRESIESSKRMEEQLLQLWRQVKASPKELDIEHWQQQILNIAEMLPRPEQITLLSNLLSDTVKATCNEYQALSGNEKQELEFRDTHRAHLIAYVEAMNQRSESLLKDLGNHVLNLEKRKMPEANRIQLTAFVSELLKYSEISLRARNMAEQQLLTVLTQQNKGLRNTQASNVNDINDEISMLDSCFDNAFQSQRPEMAELTEKLRLVLVNKINYKKQLTLGNLQHIPDCIEATSDELKKGFGEQIEAFFSDVKTTKEDAKQLDREALHLISNIEKLEKASEEKSNVMSLTDFTTSSSEFGYEYIQNKLRSLETREKLSEEILKGLLQHEQTLIAFDKQVTNLRLRMGEAEATTRQDTVANIAKLSASDFERMRQQRIRQLNHLKSLRELNWYSSKSTLTLPNSASEDKATADLIKQRLSSLDRELELFANGLSTLRTSLRGQIDAAKIEREKTPDPSLLVRAGQAWKGRSQPKMSQLFAIDDELVKLQEEADKISTETPKNSSLPPASPLDSCEIALIPRATFKMGDVIGDLHPGGATCFAVTFRAAKYSAQGLDEETSAEKLTSKPAKHVEKQTQFETGLMATEKDIIPRLQSDADDKLWNQLIENDQAWNRQMMEEWAKEKVSLGEDHQTTIEAFFNSNPIRDIERVIINIGGRTPNRKMPHAHSFMVIGGENPCVFEPMDGFYPLNPSGDIAHQVRGFINLKTGFPAEVCFITPVLSNAKSSESVDKKAEDIVNKIMGELAKLDQQEGISEPSIQELLTRDQAELQKVSNKTSIDLQKWNGKNPLPLTGTVTVTPNAVYVKMATGNRRDDSSAIFTFVTMKQVKELEKAGNTLADIQTNKCIPALSGKAQAR